MFGIKAKRRIEQLEEEIRLLKADNEVLNRLAEMLQLEASGLRENDERWRKQTETLVEKVNNLTRKRDAKGRFVKA